MSEHAYMDDGRCVRSPGLLAAVGVSAVMLTVLYGLVPYTQGYMDSLRPVFSRMYVDWHREEWAHSSIVPFLAAFMLYWRWDKIGKIPVQSTYSGLAVLMGCLLVYWFGLKVGHHYIGYISSWLTLGGLIITFLGWRFFGGVFWIWAFLLLTFPFLVLEQTIGFPLRQIMSYLASEFLSLVGVANTLSGSAILSSPNAAAGLAQGDVFALEVDNPCSGINSLFALCMVTYVYSYAAMRNSWQFLILLALAPVLAILGNFLRILMLVLGTLWFGSDFAIGSSEEPSTYHMTAGFVVFLGAFGGMLTLGDLLKRFEPAVEKFLSSVTVAPEDGNAKPSETY